MRRARAAASLTAAGIELRSIARLGDGEPAAIEVPGDAAVAVDGDPRLDDPPVGWITPQLAMKAVHAAIAASRRPVVLARTYQTMYLGPPVLFTSLV